MQYHYLNQSGVTTVENINDEKDYEELINAMDVLNMSRTERDDILTLVSAILHLGTWWMGCPPLPSPLFPPPAHCAWVLACPLCTYLAHTQHREPS